MRKPVYEIPRSQHIDFPRSESIPPDALPRQGFTAPSPRDVEDLAIPANISSKPMSRQKESCLFTNRHVSGPHWFSEINDCHNYEVFPIVLLLRKGCTTIAASLCYGISISLSDRWEVFSSLSWKYSICFEIWKLGNWVRLITYKSERKKAKTTHSNAFGAKGRFSINYEATFHCWKHVSMGDSRL